MPSRALSKRKLPGKVFFSHLKQFQSLTGSITRSTSAAVYMGESARWIITARCLLTFKFETAKKTCLKEIKRKILPTAGKLMAAKKENIGR